MAAFVTVIRETLIYSSSSEDLSILDQSHLRTNSHSCHVSLSREYLLLPGNFWATVHMYTHPDIFESATFSFRIQTFMSVEGIRIREERVD